MSKYYLCVVFAVVCLTGCVTTNPAPLAKGELNQAIAAAEEKAATRGVDYAISELEKLTQSNPADAEPWSKMAKIYFDQEQYGQAIVAADEALQRNPDDFLAKSIWVVGGLRLAQKGVFDMKNNTKLAGNAERDAVALAEAMRSALGQGIFPSVAPKSGAVQPTPAVRPSGRRDSPPAGNQPSPPQQQKPSTSSSTPKPSTQNSGGKAADNPFGLLTQ